MITNERIEQQWLALVERLAVALIPAGKLEREFTLQEIADACHRHKLLAWLLDGSEVVDVQLVEHFKMTPQSRASLAAFIHERCHKLVEIGGQRVVIETCVSGRPARDFILRVLDVCAKPAPEHVATGIEAKVCADITRRQAHGVAKYGQTVAGNPLPLKAWLQHAYEETLDKAVYLKRAIAEIEKGEI